MGRYNGSVCKLCRREGVKLMLKGDRCNTAKCAVERRNFPPGQHGRVSRKLSDFAVRLRAKQSARRYYGLSEKQFRKIFSMAQKKEGVLGTNFLQLLESRLDSVIYKCGFAESRAEARQLITHGHLKLNGKKISIPSYILKSNDVVEVANQKHKKATIQLEKNKESVPPKWLNLDLANKKVTFLNAPERQEIEVPVEEQLIVEFYSRS